MACNLVSPPDTLVLKLFSAETEDLPVIKSNNLWLCFLQYLEAGALSLDPHSVGFSLLLTLSPHPLPSSCPLNTGFHPRGLCSLSIVAVKDHPKLSDLSQHVFVVAQLISCV